MSNTLIDMNNKVSWWRTKFNNGEIDEISNAILNENISQGPKVLEFENQIAKLLEVPYVVATTSGSMSMLMALMAAGITDKDEVIIPNRTWISTAHAPKILGIKIKSVDVKKDTPIIDEDLIEKSITKKTKAIIPVYMGGRYVNFKKIKKIAKKYNLLIIEDAAQALYAKSNNKFIGTQGDIACFSLSVAKIISTGQGGFTITKNRKLYEKLLAIRTHGVGSTYDVSKNWPMLGFNFRFNDILASIGIRQLKSLPIRKKNMIKIYNLYFKELLDNKYVKVIPVNLKKGEIPLYVEALCKSRGHFITYMRKNNIDCRPFYPNVNRAKYLNINKQFKNSDIYEKNGVYLPSGPDQELLSIKKTIQIIKKYRHDS